MAPGESAWSRTRRAPSPLLRFSAGDVVEVLVPEESPERLALWQAGGLILVSGSPGAGWVGRGGLDGLGSSSESSQDADCP